MLLGGDPMRRTFPVSGAVVAVCLLAVPAGAQSDTQRKVIELAQKEAVKQLKAKLPQKIDEATTLIDVASSGVILAYSYSIDTTTRKTIPNFIELVRKSATATVCKTERQGEGDEGRRRLPLHLRRCANETAGPVRREIDRLRLKPRRTGYVRPVT